MITLKTPEELQIMKEGGEISAAALKAVLEAIKPGITLKELDAIADKTITERLAFPAFKRVYGYKYATCININEGLVHGLPDSTVVKKGDLVKVDLGAFYKGFNTDLSYTIEVETNNEEKFLNAGKKALEAAISKCVVGNTIGDISNAMQLIIEREGYSISRELIGHGVGKDLHEDPEIPGYGVPHSGKQIKEGMTFALEVIYQKGKPAIFVEADDWTIRTKDRSLAGLFEHTVAVTKDGPKVLTV